MLRAWASASICLWYSANRFVLIVPIPYGVLPLTASVQLRLTLSWYCKTACSPKDLYCIGQKFRFRKNLVSWLTSLALQPCSTMQFKSWLFPSDHWSYDNASSLVTLDDKINAAPAGCSMGPFSVLIKLNVFSGAVNSRVAASQQPWAVKCHRLMNSFFTNLLRIWWAGRMSKKFGVGTASQLDSSSGGVEGSVVIFILFKFGLALS